MLVAFAWVGGWVAGRGRGRPEDLRMSSQSAASQSVGNGLWSTVYVPAIEIGVAVADKAGGTPFVR